MSLSQSRGFITSPTLTQELRKVKTWSLSPPNNHAPGLTPVYRAEGNASEWSFKNLIWKPFFELGEFKFLISNIVLRDLKVRYKRSVLGVFWTLLSPLMNMTIMWFVFTRALKVEIPHYAVFLFSGLIAWNLFLQSTVAGAPSILNAAALIRKVRLPRALFPITVVVNNLLNWTFAMIALIIVILVSGAPLHASIIFAPVALIPLVFFCVGWSLFVSSLSVFFRDLQYILEVSLGAIFYLTPILYQAEFFPAKYSWIVSLNPIAKFIHLFRTTVYAGHFPDLGLYFMTMGIGLLMLLIGWVTFHKLQKEFPYWV